MATVMRPSCSSVMSPRCWLECSLRCRHLLHRPAEQSQCQRHWSESEAAKERPDPREHAEPVQARVIPHAAVSARHCLAGRGHRGKRPRRVSVSAPSAGNVRVPVRVRKPVLLCCRRRLRQQRQRGSCQRHCHGGPAVPQGAPHSCSALGSVSFVFRVTERVSVS